MLTRASGGVGLYATELHPLLLAETSAYYEAEASRALAALDVPAYLAHAEARLRGEWERVEACLDAPTSLRPLVALVESRLVTAAAGTLLERGCGAMLDGVRVRDLRRAYGLLARVGRLDELRRFFAGHARARVTAAVAERDEEHDKGMVPALLRLKRDMDGCVFA